MAGLCEEQRDESLRFHLGGLMTRSGYLDSKEGKKEGRREGRRNARVKRRKGVDYRGVGQERRRRTLKTQSTTILHRHPSTTTRRRGLRERPREESATLPSFRLYAISSCLSLALPPGRKIYGRSNRVSRHCESTGRTERKRSWIP
ncbi:Uncharacterized protein DBV15_00854 [Temnothorax longispinosus]|uniref:Uncharacterized protein n=1 Tax=Temnothorax longispinosus TaxID=300112 RepID=A0A4S2KKZ9_9HYME|nr:Uncharacterized protein DBV15_00854 [Temnothorax longispinosus]